MRIAGVNALDLFHVPVGCSLPNEGTNTRSHVGSWLKSGGKNANFLMRTSYGTYTGFVTLAIGAVLGLLGFRGDSKATKYLGLVLGAVGAGLAILGKFFGYENNVLDKVEDNVIFRPHLTIDEQELEKEGVTKENEVLIDMPDTENEKLHGYFIPSPIKANKVVLYLHGRAHNNGNSVKICKTIQEKIPVDVLIADYRGFGKSPGSPSEKSVVDDAEAMYNYLIKKGYKPEDIIVYGHSLGGAIGIQLAKRLQSKVKYLVVQSSFSSIKELKDDYKEKYLSFISSNPIKNVLEKVASKVIDFTVFNSKEAIKDLSPETKLLIIHGRKDDFIPYQHSQELYDSAPKDTIKKILFLDEAGHSDFAHCIVCKKESVDLLTEFLGIKTKEENQVLPKAA